MSTDAKMVLVIRKDLKMQRGKEISQGAHSAMAWLTNRLRDVYEGTLDLTGLADNREIIHKLLPSRWERDWVFGLFKKIVVVVETEAELLDIQKRCREIGLQEVLIEDHGLTQFKGVKTRTSIGIGPDDPERIDLVTKGIKLY